VAGPPSSVAAVRLAVRRALGDLPAGSHLLVAGSGGADSTALAAATAFVAPRIGLSAGFACADQHWSAGSTGQAQAAAATAATLGLRPAVVVDAPAARTECAARDARRAALQEEAGTQRAVAILLGHTLDDQAETVLLRLARGSGARSLAAMAGRDGLWRRPLLGLRRDLVRASAAACGVQGWEDPANADQAFARTRVRTQVLPLLEQALGPGVTESLARSADLLRADADALEGLATAYLDDVREAAGRQAAGRQAAAPSGALDTQSLRALLPAVRTRVLRAAALRAGCPPTALSARHVASLDALVIAWRGQGPLSLPGGVSARRCDGTIVISHPTPARLGTDSAP
jgi:tRNA(Ile)-lysidine synthase